MDERCHGGKFVHRQAVFCGRGRGTKGGSMVHYFPKNENLRIFATAGRPIAQEIGRKVRAGKSTALWKAQIGDEFMQG